MRTLVFALAFVAVSAAAQDAGFYAGGAFGQSKVKIDTGAFSSDLTSAGFGHTGVRADETDTAWKVFVGYRFSRHLALEGSFGQLGEVREEATVTSVNGIPIVPGTVRQTFEAKDAITVSALGILPLDRAHIFGRLGAYSAKVDTVLTASGTGGTASSSASDRSTGFLFGFGGGFDFTRNLGARIEWERYVKVGEKDITGEGDVDVITIGLLYRF